MVNGSYKAIDISEGRVTIRDIKERFIIVWDTKEGESLIKAINLLASENWVVRECWGFDSRGRQGWCHFTLLEHASN